METRKKIIGTIVLDSVKSQTTRKGYDKTTETDFRNETIECRSIGDEVGDYRFVTDHNGRSVWVRSDKILMIRWTE